MKNPIGGKFKDEESVSKFNEKISLGKNAWKKWFNFKIEPRVSPSKN
jgi:hypothetical protein